MGNTWWRTVILPTSMQQLTTLGDLLTLYMIFYFAAMMDQFDVFLESIMSKPRYIPKSQRWKRLNDVTKYATDKVLSYVRPMIEWFSQMDDSWENYYERVHELEYAEARRRYQLAQSMAYDYTPLSRATWEMNQQHIPRKRKKKREYWRTQHVKTIYGVETLIAHAATNTYGEEIHENIARFDTDSGKVGVDSRCSVCISHHKPDFVGKLIKVRRAIKGYGGVRYFDVWKGTICWKWADDDGILHRFLIPNSYCIPQGGCRLLSPQHFTKTQLKKSGVRDIQDLPQQIKKGIGSNVGYDRTTIYWNNGRNALTVMHGSRDNVATFYLAPGYKRFGLYCQECKINYDESQEEPIYALPAGIVSDDEDDDEDDDVQPQGDTPPQSTSFWDHLTRSTKRPPKTPPAPSASARTATFDLDGKTTDGGPKPVVIDEEEEKQATTAAQELLRYHHRFGHISFAKLQNMAKQNIIPQRLSKCQPPTCSACLFAKATRRQWRHKRRKYWTEKKQAQKPGEVVSVDQLISPTPGLVAQMTGILTKKRYTCATIYVDQFSGFGYVYLQKSTNADETIKGKKAFEATAQQHGVTIRNYHADNGMFRSHKWVEECRRNKQGLTFAGVNAHHSNGHAELHIRSLQDLTRAMLIHHNRRWRMPGTVHLWPYALRMANDAINESPNLKDKLGRSPLQMFSNTNIQLHEKHWVPFGCPTYVLNSKLQSGNSLNKWESRARVGIYLGRSPDHGRNIALVLDRVTGLVSPQFHVAFDKGFNTVKQDEFDTHWQLKAGFMGPTTNQKPNSNVSSKNKRGMPVPEGVSEQEIKRIKTGTEVSKPEVVSEGDEVDASTPGEIDELQQQLDDSQSNDQNKQQDPTSPDIIPDDGTGHPEYQPGCEPDSQQAPMTSQATQPAERIINAMTAELSNATVNDIEGEIFCFEAMFPNYAGEPEQDPLKVFKATADPDTMYMHEAMRQKDAAEFRKAMLKEWKDQFENGNFSIIHRSKVPEGATVLPAVWQMKRKRDIRTRQIKKYKARLNLDGSKMKQGKHYDQTYAPVANWNSIRTLLTVSALHGWHTRQID